MAATPQPIVMPDGGAIRPDRVIASDSYTRPANTTAYAQNDSVSDSASAPTALTFSAAGRSPDFSGKIINAVLVDANGGASTPGDFKLWLFDAEPTPTNDNAALSVSDADALNAIGVITFTAHHAGAASIVYAADQTYLPIPFVNATGILYGLLQADNAYTPASAGVLTVKLIIDQD